MTGVQTCALPISPTATVTIAGKPVAVAGGLAKLPDAKLGDQLKVEIKADGFAPVTKDILIATPTVQKEVFKLEPDKAAAVVPGVALAPGGVVAAKPEGGPGTVKVRATPWADVMVNGHKECTAPCSFSLPAGKQTVVLRYNAVTKTREIGRAHV